jgi:type I restriction enzyme, S subunit
MTRWPHNRMKYLAEINQRTLAGDEDPRRQIRYLDITSVGRGILSTPPTHTTFGEAPSRARRLVSSGDTIVSTVRTYLRSVWPVAGPVDDLVVSTGFAVLTPGQRLDSGFLGWWTQSSQFIEAIVARSVGVSYPAINASEIGNIAMPVPTIDEQTAITAFLDTETARIDKIVEQKQEMTNALEERWQAVLNDTFTPTTGLRLKHLLSAALAYGVLVPEHDPRGVPMLRIMDLIRDDVDLASVSRISPDLSAQYRRTVLATGDLVVSVVGTLGRSIEVTADLEGCNINRPLARVQLLPKVPRSLVRFWFESRRFQDLALLATSGDSAQPTLGLGDLKNFVIGLPTDPATWPAMATQLEQQHDAVEKCIASCRRQIELLIERRQALITAAVTGELDIPGLAK